MNEDSGRFFCVCGYSFTVTLDDDENVWFFGANEENQFDPKKEKLYRPILLSKYKNIKQIACTNSSLYCITQEGKVLTSKLRADNFQNFSSITFVACGDSHTVFIDSHSNAWGLGSNGSKQLGEINGDHCLRTPQRIPFDKNIKLVSCGADHTIFLDHEGSMHACGSNLRGQLGQADFNETYSATILKIPLADHCVIDYVVSGSWFSIAFSMDKKVYSWGYNIYGQIGIKDVLQTHIPTEIQFDCEIEKVSCGYYHSIFLDTTGDVWVCGRNEDGQLGTGKDSHSHEFVPVKLENIPPIRDISYGGCQTILCDIDNNIWSFGKKGSGQLGRDVTNFNIPVQLESKYSSIFGFNRSRFSKAKSARK